MRGHGACHVLFKVKTLGDGLCGAGYCAPLNIRGVHGLQERTPTLYRPEEGQTRIMDDCRPVGVRLP